MKSDSERLAVIESTVTKIDHRLFGNGQPGELSSLRDRVGRLENWKWWVCGIAVGLGIVIGGTAKAVAEAILK